MSRGYRCSTNVVDRTLTGPRDGQGSWHAGFWHVQTPSKVQNPGSFSSALMLGVRSMFNLERGWGTLTRHLDR